MSIRDRDMQASRLRSESLVKRASMSPGEAITKGNVSELLKAMMPQIERALPTVYARGGLDVDRFARLLMTTVRKTPALLKCSQESLLGALLEVGRIGLEPSSNLVHLIPYKNSVEVIISAQGYKELALRTGRVLKVESRAVFDGDLFEVDYGATDSSSIQHVPRFASEDVTHAWARALGRDGQVWIEVMHRRQIAKIASGRRGPWQTDYAEMARKTAIRRLAKQLPQSGEIADAQRIDDGIVTSYNPSSSEAEIEHFDRAPDTGGAPIESLPPEFGEEVS